MEKFTVVYMIKFVDGNLKGLTIEQELSYPVSLIETVIADFTQDVKSERVMGGPSRYFITEFAIKYNMKGN